MKWPLSSPITNTSKDCDNCLIYLMLEKIASFLTHSKLPLEIYDPDLLDGPTH